MVSSTRVARTSRSSPAPAARHHAFKAANTVLGNIKCAIAAAFRSGSKKHAPRRFAEFEYRFNRRYDLPAHDALPRLGRCANAADAVSFTEVGGGLWVIRKPFVSPDSTLWRGYGNNGRICSEHFCKRGASSDQAAVSSRHRSTATPRTMRSHRTARPPSRTLYARHVASSACPWSEITNVADIIRRLAGHFESHPQGR